MLPSGRQRLLHNRIHWAKFYMSKAGLIASPARGRFTATEAGRGLLAEKPERVDTAMLMRFPSFREFYRNDQPSPDGAAAPATEVPSPEASSTPEERIEAAYQWSAPCEVFLPEVWLLAIWRTV